MATASRGGVSAHPSIGPGTKELVKRTILVVAAFASGFALQSVLAVGFRKERTAVFLAEARGEVGDLRAKVAAFHARHGRYPRDPAEMEAAGFWSASSPPSERLRGCADWSSVYDGHGGFLYLSATGAIYLNTDLTREKLRVQDIAELTHGDLLPPGTFF